MRDQYYGDRKDLWKWTVTVHEAERISAKRIIYGAMMRPDVPAEQNHGLQFGVFEGADPRVVGFFNEERLAFGLGQANHIAHPHNRRVKRIVRINPIIVTAVIYVGALYRARHADAYFTEQLIPWLTFRNAGDNFVILLDPDTGCAQGENPNDCQLGLHQLLEVWDTTIKGDTLILHSEPDHANGLEGEGLRIGNVLGVQVVTVRCSPCAGRILA